MLSYHDGTDFYSEHKAILNPKKQKQSHQFNAPFEIPCYMRSTKPN